MSRESWRISGKRLSLPSDAGKSEWKLSLRPGGWWIAERALTDGETERRRFMALESKGKLSVQLGGSAYFGELSATSRATRAAGGAADSDLVAQFPGKVRKVLVQEGTKVSSGDPLLLIEAMKMEFSVKAPADGVVKSVRVSEGQQLSPGDRFLDLEPAGNGDGRG